jgi:hypothetical protein
MFPSGKSEAVIASAALMWLWVEKRWMVMLSMDGTAAVQAP